MMNTTSIVVGIDAGGTRTRARAVADDEIVHDGSGGPGNPLAVSTSVLAQSYRSALDGCPEPAVVAVCAAGAGNQDGRRRIELVLRDRFPAAELRVAPDYVAALVAAGEAADIVVVAGTGSVVCSRAAAGRARVSGGHGWIVGDHGSARPPRAPCSRSLLRRRQRAARRRRAAGVRDDDPRRLVAALHNSGAPAAWLARAAPLLTAAVETGADGLSPARATR